MAELISSSVHYGTTRAISPGTWIVSHPTQEPDASVLAEGPPLDLLLATTPGLTLRPATPLERLIGRPAQPGDLP
jgi:hypothetical protein